MMRGNFFRENYRCSLSYLLILWNINSVFLAITELKYFWIGMTSDTRLLFLAYFLIFGVHRPFRILVLSVVGYHASSKLHPATTTASAIIALSGLVFFLDSWFPILTPLPGFITCVVATWAAYSTQIGDLEFGNEFWVDCDCIWGRQVFALNRITLAYP